MWTVLVGLLCLSALPGLLFGLREHHLLVLRDFCGRQRDLNLSPNELSATDVIFLISIFVIRAGKIKLGIRSSLAAIRASDQPDQPASTVKEEVPLGHPLTMPFRLTSSDIRKYALAVDGSVVPSNDNEHVEVLQSRILHLLGHPAHVCLFLAAVCQPAMYIILAQSDCPIQPLGAVNARNHLELLDYELARNIIASCLDAGRTAFPVNVRAHFLSSTRKVKRGIEVDISVSLVVPETQGRKEETKIFEQIFTVLEFVRWPKTAAASLEPSMPRSALEDSSHPGMRQSGPEGQPNPSTGAQLSCHMTAEDPGRWAALCLDYNPIHHLTVAARLAGFSGRIAHGNHVAARAIEQMQRRMPDWVSPRGASQVLFAMDVSFKKPVTVPSSLDVCFDEDAAGLTDSPDSPHALRVDICRGNRTHVELVLGVDSR